MISKVFNSLFLILLIQSAVFSSFMKSKVKAKDVTLDITDFTSIVETWKTLFQQVHALSDDLYDSVGKDSAISKSNFKKVWSQAFPLEDVDKVPKELLSFWLLSVKVKGKSVDKDTAYRATQNGVVTGTLINLYAGAHFQSSGAFADRIDSIVDAVTSAHVNFDTYAKELFLESDINDNGQLSLEEFQDTYGKLLDSDQDAEEMFDEVDTEGHGYLDQQEATHLLGKILLKENPYFIINTQEHLAVDHEHYHDHAVAHVGERVHLGRGNHDHSFVQRRR